MLGLAVKFFAAIAPVCLSVSLTFAAGWDFSGDRAPPEFHQGPIPESSNDRVCRTKLDAAYSAYAKLHPEFYDLKDQPGMRDRWRFNALKASIRVKKSDLFACALFELHRDVLHFRKYEVSAKRYFCGVIASGLSSPEKLHAMRMRDLLIISSLGSELAALMLLPMSDTDSRVRLHPEVRFYVQESMWYFGFEAVFHSYGEGFTPVQKFDLPLGRMAEISAAVKRLDLKYVTGSLKDCNREQ